MPLPTALASLLALKRWVIWMAETRGDKITKPPRQAHDTSRYASTGDPRTWSTYEQAVTVAARLRLNGTRGGVGFVLTDTNIIGFDLDKCIDENGVIAPWAMALIKRTGSYAELSPSGNGVHILGRSQSRIDSTAVHSAGDNGRIEVYRNTKRFLTVTGRQIAGSGDELCDLDAVVDEMVRRDIAKPAGTIRGLGGAPDSSTSGLFHKKVCKLFDSGLEPAEVLEKYRKKPKGWEDTKAAKYDEEDRLLQEIERCYAKWRESKGAQLEVAWSNGRLPSKTLCADAKIAIAALGVTCRSDCFHLVDLIDGEIMGRWGGRATDDSILWLRKLIWDHFKFDPGKDLTHDAVHQLGMENAFDPVLDYLADVQGRWDNKARLDHLAARYFGAPDTELNRMIARTALVAAVRRARQPGVKFDQIIVLEGEEGTNKSTAIMILAGAENFSDQSILGSRDEKQQEGLRGRWLYEIADLKGINYADVEAVKAFASRTHDRGRKAWGRIVEDQPRRCILFATTNDKNYLKGDTGNRRWWPLPCGRVNIPLLKRDRDQLWAEAAELEAQGEDLILPAHLWERVKKEQDERLEEHPWMEILRLERGTKHVLRSPTDKDPGLIEERISSDYLLRDVLKIETPRLATGNSKQVGTLMRRLGWDGPKPLRVQRGSEPTKGYSRLLPVGNRVVDLDEVRRRKKVDEE